MTPPLLSHLLPLAEVGGAGLPAVLLLSAALGVACAVLSVFVVTKRWAFIGEGIAHAGFGGAGTAWLLALAFPSATWLSAQGTVYAISVGFCFLVALAIAAITHRRESSADASGAAPSGGTSVDSVVGIFLVASLAWGFLAYGIYAHKTGHMPDQFGEYLGFARLRGLGTPFVVMALAVSAAVVALVALAWKELLFYATDERQARASGVPVALAHYGLILLLTLVIIVGMRLMGTVLVVALLVLPGATGLLLGRSTRAVWTASIAAGLTGALAGPLISYQYPLIPEGPAIVLSLFLLFLTALSLTFIKPRARPG